MVTVDLAPGQHTIKMSLTGYSLFEAVINVSITGKVTCVSVVAGICNRVTAPGLMINSNVVTGFLKAAIGFDGWVSNKGGIGAFSGNLLLMGEAIDGYLGIKDLGFTMSLLNIGSIINYYLGVG